MTNIKRFLASQFGKIFGGQLVQDTVVGQASKILHGLQLNSNQTVAMHLNNRLLDYERFSALHPRSNFTPVPLPISQDNLEISLKNLEKRFPRLFPIWKDLQQNGELSYVEAPESSVSTVENSGSVLFKAFCLPLLRGHVLDVGCGPVSVPIYLDGYEYQSMAGFDPFGSQEDHPFCFVRAIAESIPWSSDSFDTVVVATSLDHLLDLEQGVSEIFRVLRSGGDCILWMWFLPGAPKYDPSTLATNQIDQFHLFHFDRPWFLDLIKKFAYVVEEINVDGFSHFYRVRKR